jgi:alpha-L-arabinofuranosidase
VTSARGTDGAIYVGLVNSDPNQPADVTLALGGTNAGRVAGQVLTAAKIDSHNRFGAAEEVHPVPFTGASWRSGSLGVAMPAKSIVVLSIK